ncbi:hypothetical protein [Massilia sp. 9096]|uniref:hypothetical protein n=1 Tax=Massilia sp. 9096 TaxID=1500894 RepID=UPI0012E00393|nr:hypothetical protein [Massilia sp. 9096]
MTAQEAHCGGSKSWLSSVPGRIVVDWRLVGYGGLVASGGNTSRLDGTLLLLASDVNQSSRVLMSGRFYTCTIAFQMLQQQKCSGFG